jgi:site-specific DNA recombinase
VIGINIVANTLLVAKCFAVTAEIFFKRRHWNSTNASKKIVWQCKTIFLTVKTSVVQRPNIRATEALDYRIEELKNELKVLIRFQVNNRVDSEVYTEEYKSISGELEEVRKKRLELDKINESKDDLKQRFGEIVQAINSRDSLLEEFDEEIFNALVEKICDMLPPDRTVK